ncbi:crustacean cardioactive peptide-like [Homarus americanus]|uniref:Crustacean cardioactive peptide-like n=1 Tax=Homarus americanus TaxID=6706 RepID=A0A8J5JRZ8_HOMAM|nr:crustacean cardioactive peptide-like [Homarus americanus]
MTNMSWCGRVGILGVTTVLLLVLLAAHAQAGPVAKRDIGDLLEGKDKRPFCNAFTGCGKKRSDPSMEGLASSSELDALAKHMEMMRSYASRMENHPVYRRKRSTPHTQPRQHLTSTPQQKVETEKQ